MKYVVTKPKSVSYKVSTHLTMLFSPKLLNLFMNFHLYAPS